MNLRKRRSFDFAVAARSFEGVALFMAILAFGWYPRAEERYELPIVAAPECIAAHDFGEFLNLPLQVRIKQIREGIADDFESSFGVTPSSPAAPAAVKRVIAHEQGNPGYDSQAGTKYDKCLAQRYKLSVS